MRTGCAVRRRQKQFGELFLTRGPLGESVLSHQTKRLATPSLFCLVELSVPNGTISTPSVREVCLRQVKCLRAWVAHLTSL